MLQEAIRRREVERRYLALVRGRPRSRTGRIDAPIGRDRRDPTRRSLDTEEPREAVTYFEVMEIAARARASRRAPGDGADTPDSRPPRRDRPSGLRRPVVRGEAGPRARAAVPARPSAALPASGHGCRGRPRVTAPGGPRGRARDAHGACRTTSSRGGYTPAVSVLRPGDQPRRGCRRRVRGSARPVGDTVNSTRERG